MKDYELLDHWWLDRQYSQLWHKCPEGGDYRWARKLDEKVYCGRCAKEAPQAVMDLCLLAGAKVPCGWRVGWYGSYGLG